MAVYTNLQENDFSTLLNNYNQGELDSYHPIAEGVENTNYLVKTDQNKFILTIYEKRTSKEDLPFYISFMNHLAKEGIPCPLPINDKNNSFLQTIKNKPALIVSFLEGKSSNNITTKHCEELGKYMAELHLASNNFSQEKPNDFSLKCWQKLFDQTKQKLDSLKPGLKDEIAGHLNHLKDNWPTDLPQGVIHADLFPDNVFFINNQLSGLIDFYFACNDFYMYDIAICLNAWCFEDEKDFNITKARALLSSYNKVRKISKAELEALPILSSGAAMRFLLTRLYDWLNPVEGALVKPKDPREYLNKLRFHQGVKSHKEYGI